MALLAMAAVGPAVHAGLRPVRVVVFAAVGALMAMVAAAASSDFRLLLGPAIDRAPVGGPGAFGQVGVALLWLALGTAFIFPVPWGGRRRAPWIGVMLLSLAEARLALAASIGGDPVWMLTSQLFRLFGVGAALGGAFHQLQLAFTVQRANLLESLEELGSARAERRAAEATAEERAHDLRSALAGIGGAAVTLERYHSRLSDEERASLARAVTAEIARLQQIVGHARPGPAPFEVQPALEPVLVCSGSRHSDIALDIPQGLTAFGRSSEVAEVVQNLVDNAAQHAGTEILVRARQRGASVEIRVEDRGPGIAARDRQQIFKRGWRGNLQTEGSGLGLFNARELVREQKGALWVEERAGGGASFVVALPGGTAWEGAR
jgi:signal transduction histidine kinase